MKYMNTFLMSMAVSTCIFTAGQIINADSTSLFSGSKVSIDECDIKGQLVREDDGIYARFTVANETGSDKSMRFYYAANHTPASSRMSRMGPRSNRVKGDECKLEISAGNTETIEILIKKEARTPVLAIAGGTEKTMSPEYWSLMVAKDPIKVVQGWGAVIPAVAVENVKLEKGTAVLDSGEVKESAAKQG